MTTKAISALAATNTVDATTVAPVVYSGTTYKATLTKLGAFITTNAVTVSASGNITGGNLNAAGMSLSSNVVSALNVTGAIAGANLTTPGLISATGNITGGNILGGANVNATTHTGTTVSVSGNITGGNILGGANVNATTHTGTTVSVSGNITGGNILGGANVNATTHTGTTVSVSGNITGGNLNAAGLSLSSNVVSALNVTGAIAGANLTTPGLISATGNITGGNVNVGNITIATDLISSLGTTLTIDPATVGNAGLVVINGNLQVNGTTTTINSNVVSTNDLTVNYANNAINAAAANGGGIEVGPIGSPFITWLYNSTANVFTSSGGISAVGNITGGNLNAAGLSLSSNVVSALNVTGAIAGANVTTPGLISATGNITGGNILGGANVNATTHTGATVSVSGNITGGNLITSAAISAASVSASGNITGGNILGGANVNATTHTGTTVSVSGNITGGNIITSAAVSAASLSLSGSSQSASYSASGNITGGNLITSAAISAASVSASGNITAGNLIVAGSISDAGQLDITTTASNGNIVLTPNGTGNVNIDSNIIPTSSNATANIGSATASFNTVFAKATSAQYADLAEKYTADAEYTPGTVLSFGGSQEVTLSLIDADHRVAGVVSTNSAYIMNAGLTSEHVATVALTGRVPCSVTGTVRKGDSMVSAGNGVARAEANPAVSTVIGKALENFDGESGVIEVVVGRV